MDADWRGLYFVKRKLGRAEREALPKVRNIYDGKQVTVEDLRGIPADDARELAMRIMVFGAEIHIGIDLSVLNNYTQRYSKAMDTIYKTSPLYKLKS